MLLNKMNQYNRIDTMKKITTILLFTVTLFAAFSTASMAQNDATTTASANVIAGFDVTKTADLDFDNVVTGSSKFLDADGLSVTSDYVTGNEGFGVVKIEYVAQQTVDVSISFPVKLKKDGIADTDVTLAVDNSADGNGGTGANAILAYKDAGNSTTIFGNVGESDIQVVKTTTDWVDGPNNADFDNFNIDNVSIPSTGKLYVVVGGKVTATQTQANEEYQGTITVTAQLNEN